jgi:hypothetical protein
MHRYNVAVADKENNLLFWYVEACSEIIFTKFTSPPSHQEETNKANLFFQSGITVLSNYVV